MSDQRFWETKRLDEMTHDEWEAICDGCARCCLVKLEDEDDGTVYYTDVACALLDLQVCRCGDYANRISRVPSCLTLSPSRLDDLWMMPTTCSYRRLAEGKQLPSWHHLIAGDAAEIHERGWSIRDRAISEQEIPADADLEDRLVDWPILNQAITPGRQDP